MFLSLVIGRFKGYLRCKYSKNNKNIKTNCIYFNLINLSTILLITNCNNDIMRQLLKFMNYAAQLMALIDIGRTIKRWATKNDTTSDGQTKNKT